MQKWMILALATAVACDDSTTKDDSGSPVVADDTATGDDTGSTGDVDGDGYTTEQGDCDDTDASLFPGATETWYDGVDSDCAGDDDDDADGDSWPQGDDCDDGDAAVNPDAEEVCDNGVDDDCDGVLTGCGPWQDTSVSEADATLYGETDGVRLGQGDPGVDAIGDIDGDGFGDILVASIFEGSVATRQGAAYVVNGPLSGTAVVSDVASAKLTGDADNDWTGRSVTGPGDLDGDGYDDLFIGESQDDTTGEDAGAAYVFYGPVSGTADIASAADAVLLADAAGDFMGELGWVGDTNGDGAPDLLVSAQFNSSNGENCGAVYVYTDPEALLTSRSAIFGEEGDEVGSSVWGAGDVDGDGMNDILFAARGDDEAGEDAGAAFVFFGGLDGDHVLPDADIKLTGESAGAQIGWGVSVSSAGDVNGDGHTDLVIGARHDDEAAEDAGGAYVVLGPLSLGTSSLASAGAKLLGETADDYTGDSVHGPGDVDGDGFDDVIVGSGYNGLGADNAGAVYIVRGPISGTSSLADADGMLRGAAAEDRLRGHGGGDLDGDGLADVLVTAQLNDDNGDAAGAVYLFGGAGW